MLEPISQVWFDASPFVAAIDAIYFSSCPLAAIKEERGAVFRVARARDENGDTKNRIPTSV
jgi:hypothetical protein